MNMQLNHAPLTESYQPLVCVVDNNTQAMQYNEGAKSRDSLDPLAHLILNAVNEFLLTHNFISTKQIFDELDLPAGDAAIRTRLRTLVDMGLLGYIKGSGRRPSHYISPDKISTSKDTEALSIKDKNGIAEVAEIVSLKPENDISLESSVNMEFNEDAEYIWYLQKVLEETIAYINHLKDELQGMESKRVDYEAQLEILKKSAQIKARIRNFTAR